MQLACRNNLVQPLTAHDTTKIVKSATFTRLYLQRETSFVIQARMGRTYEVTHHKIASAFIFPFLETGVDNDS